MYRVEDPQIGKQHFREWRRRARRTLGMLLLVMVGTSLGVALLDSSKTPVSSKLFTAVWDSMNLVTTLGDFSEFNPRQKVFMAFAMFATMLIVGYAVSTLSGMLSGDEVMARRENRVMERKLRALDRHVPVAGFGALGELVAGYLRDTGEVVLVLATDARQAKKASDENYMVVLGEAASFDNILRRARLDTARALVLTEPDTSANLAATLVAHTLNPMLPIIVSCENNLRKMLLEEAGASAVVNLTDVVARILAEQIKGKDQLPR
ncbi:potassium channel family protein [Paraburkholderia oxyphila]|uniref:potassium channel family protein n=1 Tax=Paraburkholderia oxyphila TaxID=614212 RepID=UPI000489AE5C|nr:NAD(P)-binding protein [Paraburkholderia oxyphila]